MKYTKEQLHGMSDFEVNKTLATLLGWRVAELDDSSMWLLTSSFHERYPDTIWAGKPDQAWEQYCFTSMDCAGDIMPLAFEHDVTYVKSADCAYQELADGPYGFDHGIFYNDESNPLRAIACCLILILQEK